MPKKSTIRAQKRRCTKLKKSTLRRRKNAEARRRAKREEAIYEDVGYGDEENGVDRLSDLPNHIIHHILLRLPVKDAAATRALSRRWPGYWASCPILCFDESSFGANNFAACEYDLEIREVFAVFLAESLRQLKNCTVKYTLDHFGLWVASFDDDSASVVNDWLNFSLENNIKQLDLGLRRISSTYEFEPFRLCDNIFISQSLTQLYLEFCMVDPYCYIDLPSLRKLSLSEVEISEYTFGNLILGCPQLEDVQLMFCRGLSDINISNANLKRVKLNLTSLSTVNIESSRLESIELSGHYCTFYAPVDNVKDIKLKDLTISGEDLRGVIPGAPLLENLVVEGCSKLLEFEVSNENLRSLVIARCRRLSMIKIDAPRLHFFQCSGEEEEVSFSSRTNWDSLNTTIRLEPETLNEGWYMLLKSILEEWDGHLFQVFTFSCCSDKVICFPEEFFSELIPPVQGIKHLNFEIGSSSTIFKDFLKGLVWVLPDLETLSIKMGSSQTTIKLSALKQIPERILRKKVSEFVVATMGIF